MGARGKARWRNWRTEPLDYRARTVTFVDYSTPMVDAGRTRLHQDTTGYQVMSAVVKTTQNRTLGGSTRNEVGKFK